MGWADLVKRYVWDREKTPYLTPPSRLSRTQARNELFVYTVLLAPLSATLTVVALGRAGQRDDAVAFAIAAHAFSVLASAVVLGVTKRVWAARYCLTAPMAVILIVATDALGPSPGPVNTALILAMTVAWLAYAVRVVAVARAFVGRAEA